MLQPPHMIMFIFNSVFYLCMGLVHVAKLFGIGGACEWTCWSLILLFGLLHYNLSFLCLLLYVD